MRSLEKRLSNLERKFHCEPVILKMPDGSTEEIMIGSGDGLLDLLMRSMSEMEAGAEFSRDIDLIQRSVDGHEPGGYMVELIRAVMDSPVLAEKEVRPNTAL